MLFNSYVFLLGFLPLVLAGWWGLRPDALRLGFLTLASWVFYAWWDWRFLPLLVLSTSVDWVAARLIDGSEDGRRRRAVLVAALGINLGILGFFKYAGFFLASLDGLGRLVGADPHLPSLDIVLPIGISFYTFNSLSYTIDVYRRVVRPADSVLQYTAFVALFPHLIAGPIVRFADLHEQLRRPARRLTGELAWAGLVFLVCGLVKKVVIADGLAGDVDLLFAVHGSLGMAGAWAAALGYSLQLYFDFSGYSDMAVGLALLLGFHFPQNFDSPYKSASIAEFWRRWHMSLSFWLRDYLFIPLGGSRGSRLETLRIKKDVFLSLLKEFPELSIEMMKVLASRLARTTAELTDARNRLKAAGAH